MIDINAAVKNADLLNLERETQKWKLLPIVDFCRANMTPYLETNFTSLELWKRHL